MKNVPREDKLTVTSFDGKGVPVIKDEAAKIVGRLGKGEKNQKKKEALVGVKYNISPNIRSAEEVAQNLIYPEAKKSEEKKPEEKKPEEKKVKNKAENKRYIASIEKSKKQVMEEIHESIQEKDYSKKPLTDSNVIFLGLLYLSN
jgi:rubrerythrin